MDKLSLLIVDDEIDTLNALKLGLKDENYNILTASSRNEALNIIKSEVIDITVTDLKLKDGSGLDILNFIQDKYPQISVILMTAFGSVSLPVTT